VNIINQQVNIMLNDGLLNRKAKNMYPHKNLMLYKPKSGYRDTAILTEKWLNFVEEIKKNTRRFAKRQLTWFKRDGTQWFHFETPPTIIRLHYKQMR
jgi:tRNA dimethylallyltransferase